jgi:hypothetical protein
MSLKAPVDRLPTMGFAVDVTCYLSDSAASLLRQVFPLLCLPNRPCVNPVATRKNHIRWIIDQISIEATIISSSPNCPKGSTTPKENHFFSSVLQKLLIQGPKRSAVSLGVEIRLKAIWKILQTNLATGQ